MAAKTSGTKLTVVSDEVYRLDRKPETPTERIRRLQDEARLLAREQVENLDKSIRDLERAAEEIAKGGESYPAGIRELAARMVEDLRGKSENFQALMARIPPPKLR